MRGMILEKIGPLRKKLLGKDAEQDGKVINPFIRLVTERAAGSAPLCEVCDRGCTGRKVPGARW